MKPWLIPVLLAAGGLVWLEFRRPNPRHLALRITAVLVAVAAFVVLLSLRPGGRSITILTPGAPIAARSRDAVTLDQVQTLGNAAATGRPVRLVGWGLLPHEWPDSAAVTTFEPAELPAGIVTLDAPGEVAVGEPLIVRGRVHGAGRATMLLLEDPAGVRDSTQVSDSADGFLLRDRPKAAGPVEYRLRLRRTGAPEIVETLAVAVRPATMPGLLVLDASPSFETATLKRWLAERGAAVTVRTRISRERYRTEILNGSAEVAGLTGRALSRFDAVLADGGTLAALGPAERSALERQVRERGLGLLVTADAPALLGRGAGGVLGGFAVEARSEGAGARRLVRPAWSEAPRRSRTGIDAEPASLTAGERLIQDQLGGGLAATRNAGAGRVAVTLLRSPSRWLLENEPDLYSAYWYTLLGAVTRDTLTRIALSGDGPLRVDHPVRITIDQPIPDSAAPFLAVRAPDGRSDTLALAQSPFDPAQWSGSYWPHATGWHSAVLRGREVPFRVTTPGEWAGLDASARLAATMPRLAGMTATAGLAAPGRAWLTPLAFLALLLALTWLWLEGRRAG